MTIIEIALSVTMLFLWIALFFAFRAMEALNRRIDAMRDEFIMRIRRERE